MAVNKVVINQDGVENVLVDITDSTVTPNDMPEGVTAYDKSGEKITGSMPWIYKGVTHPIVFTDYPYSLELDGTKYLLFGETIKNRTYIKANDVLTMAVPMSDFGNATPDDVAVGKTFFSANDGSVVQGSLPNLSNVIVNGTQILHYIGDDGKYRLVLFGDSEDRGVLDVGSGVRIDCPVSSALGDATPDDVSSAVSFTSAEGVNIVGNLYPLYDVSVPESKLYMTTLPNGERGIMLIGKSEERGIVGLDSDVYARHPLSSFGDVKASEVVYGKTFTSADGLRMTGTGGEHIIKAENATIGVRNAGDTVGVAQAYLQTENGFVIRPDAVVEVEFPLSALGDATPEDVLAGKEFSSADGILRVGTFEPGPGSIEVTDDGNGNLTITNAVVTDNGGNINVTM